MGYLGELSESGKMHYQSNHHSQERTSLVYKMQLRNSNEINDLCDAKRAAPDWDQVERAVCGCAILTYTDATCVGDTTKFG
jgi:hypothetical protein